MTKRTVDRVLAGIPDRRRVRTRDVQSLADARREFDAAERDRDEMQAKVRAAIRSGASSDEVRNRYGAEQTKIEARFKAAAKALADSRDVHGWGKDVMLRLDRALAAVPDKRARDDRDPNQSDLDAAARGLRMTGMSPSELDDLSKEHENKPLFASRVIFLAARQMAAAKRRMGHRDAALRRDKHHRALDAILARIPRWTRATRDDDLEGDLAALKDHLAYAVRLGYRAMAENLREDIRLLEARIKEARGQPRLRRDALNRALHLVPDHRRPARRAADRLRRGLGLDSILSKSDARAILREYHAGSKKRLQDLARELKLDERAALAWVLKEAESGKDARDASYLVTAKFADNSTFRQIYQDASEAEAKYADLAADPKVVDCDIQDYEGTPEFEVGDALTEAEMYKAGARMARTGSGKIQVVEKWIEENNLTPNLAAAVMRGFRAEQQSNSHSGRLGGGRTGDALDRVLAAIPNRKRRV